MQPAVGVPRLPAGGEVTRIGGIFQKTGQLGLHASGLGLIGQPDIALRMLLNSQNNPLRRHIVDKRLGHARVGKRGNH